VPCGGTSRTSVTGARRHPARHHEPVRRAQRGHTGEVYGECKPTRNSADFLAFLKKAVKPHKGKAVHIVLDNLSTHATPDVQTWLANNPPVELPLHPGRIVLAEPDRELVLDHHPTSHPTRHLQLGHDPHRADPGLHPALELQRQALRLDRHRQ